MVSTAKRVEYYTTEVPHTAGAGASVLTSFKKQGVNLLAFSGFPDAPRRAQLDFIPEDAKAFLAAAAQAKIKLAGPKVAFQIRGDDRPGIVADILKKLSDARVNVTAIQVDTAGKQRYGALVWVKQADVSRAAKALGAR